MVMMTRLPFVLLKCGVNLGGKFLVMLNMKILMMVTLITLVLMVSNEFRTDTEFSSLSPSDNFSQIIFASAHSFITEKYHHLDIIVILYFDYSIIMIISVAAYLSSYDLMDFSLCKFCIFGLR